MGGPPGLSEGVRNCEAGVVGVRNPLTGLAVVEGVVALAGVPPLAAVLNDRLSLVGDITLFDGCWGKLPIRYPGKNPGGTPAFP